MHPIVDPRPIPLNFSSPKELVQIIYTIQDKSVEKWVRFIYLVKSIIVLMICSIGVHVTSIIM